MRIFESVKSLIVEGVKVGPFTFRLRHCVWLTILMFILFFCLVPFVPAQDPWVPEPKSLFDYLNPVVMALICYVWAFARGCCAGDRSGILLAMLKLHLLYLPGFIVLLGLMGIGWVVGWFDVGLYGWLGHSG